MDVSENILTAFESVSTGNVADAMHTMGLPSGVIEGLSPGYPGQVPACGRAVTIAQRPATGIGTTKQRTVITTMAGKGDTVVIDARGSLVAATAGGLLGLCAKRHGVKGFVVNGCLRDLDEFQKMKFAVHLIGRSPAASKGVFETESINAPLTLGNTVVNPGDLVLQDSTGCVVIPQEKAEQVLRVSKQISLQEKRCEELLMQDWDFQKARTKGIEEYPITEEMFR